MKIAVSKRCSGTGFRRPGGKTRAVRTAVDSSRILGEERKDECTVPQDGLFHNEPSANISCRLLTVQRGDWVLLVSSYLELGHTRKDSPPGWVPGTCLCAWTLRTAVRASTLADPAQPPAPPPPTPAWGWGHLSAHTRPLQAPWTWKADDSQISSSFQTFSACRVSPLGRPRAQAAFPPEVTFLFKPRSSGRP